LTFKAENGFGKIAPSDKPRALPTNAIRVRIPQNYRNPKSPRTGIPRNQTTVNVTIKGYNTKVIAEIKILAAKNGVGLYILLATSRLNMGKTYGIIII